MWHFRSSCCSLLSMNGSIVETWNMTWIRFDANVVTYECVPARFIDVSSPPL